VTLAPAAAGPVTVVVQTTSGTATANTDYTPTGPTTLTFNPGETSKPFTVPILGDTLVEPNETIVVTLTSPTNAALGKAQGTITITDDDAPSAAASLWVYDLSVVEGNGGPTTMTFTVGLNRVTTAPVTVQYATTDGSATVADGNYQTASGTLTFNSGELTKTFTVTVTGDTRGEGNETFTVTLSSPTNASIGKAVAIGTIVNDEIGPATACGPRPPVAVTCRRTGDGRLEVTVTAGAEASNVSNRLTELRFGAGANALVDVAGQTGRTGAFTLPLPERPTSLTFFVRRATAGQGTTVPITVVDTCGGWPTFVGGGPGAF
jgi:hypothetical protein